MTAQGDDVPIRAPSVWFCGDGCVSGVGSLPFVDPAAAVHFVAEYAPEVPFWPQLRRKCTREAMIPQTLGAAFRHVVAVRGEHAYAVPVERVDRLLNALESGEARFEPGAAAGYFAFVEGLERGLFARARTIKGQVMGPVTVACMLLAEGSPLLDRPEARAAIGDYIVRLARWQSEALLRYVPSVLLVLDDAYLGAALRRDPERRAAIVDLLRSVILRVRRPGVLVGLHCCDQVPLSIIADLEPDLYSFDAYHGGGDFAGDADARRYVVGGGNVAWGWIPTLDDLSGVDAEVIAARWFDSARRLVDAGEGVDLDRIRARSLVTASCGLAGSSEATCRRSFELALEVSRGFARRLESA